MLKKAFFKEIPICILSILLCIIVFIMINRDLSHLLILHSVFCLEKHIYIFKLIFHPKLKNINHLVREV